MKCAICGNPTQKWYDYCPRCRNIVVKDETLRKKALQSAYDPEIDGFRCHYTGLPLDTENQGSPFYMSFDHPVPGDNSKLLACARFINELKSAMTETEFRSNMVKLASHFETGIPLTRRQFKVSHFNPGPKKAPKTAAPMPSRKPAISRPPGTCTICGKAQIGNILYCERCQKIMHGREETTDKRAALQAAYDRKRDGFRCHYTGIVVDLTCGSDQYHLSFDHRFPGEKGNIVVSIRLVNIMKSELADFEFITLVKQLARHFRTGEPFDLAGVEFKYWNRLRAVRV